MSCSSTVSSDHTKKAKISDTIMRIAIATSFGYLAGRIITFINPMCGAIFTCVASTIQIASKEIFRKSTYSDNICFATAFVSLTSGYIVANYFAKFTLLHAFSIFSLGVISIVALEIIMDRI